MTSATSSLFARGWALETECGVERNQRTPHGRENRSLELRRLYRGGFPQLVSLLPLDPLLPGGLAPGLGRAPL